MKTFFDLFCRLIMLVLTVRLAATPTIEVSTGSATSPVRLSLSVENRVATRAPQAPDLATAYWVVTPLPIVVRSGSAYYGAVRSINAHGDVLGNDLSVVKHIAADGTVRELGSYNFHFNGGRQLDDAGRVVLNSRLGTDGFLFKVTGSSQPEETRYAGTRLTSLDNAGGLLGVTLSEASQSDPDYWGVHFVEREGRRRELELPADSNFGADLMALNERDEVVGGALQIPRDWWRGLYLKPGRDPRWLPGFGQYEDVYNLNIHGQLVGSTAVPAGFGYAPGVYPALWDSGGVGRVKVLDTDRSLFGGEYGWAWAANRWGHIVGRTRSGGALWLNGSPYDFSGRIINPDNIRLDYFADINDKGEIVGAEYGFLASPRTFIMRPVWPSLAVDLNRDGKIALPLDGDKSDVTSPAMPFRFWVNDDDDGNALNNESEVEGGSTRDSETRGDFGISSKRDLEDFARIHLHIGGLHDALKNGEIKIGLKWEASSVTGAPSINLYKHFEADGGAAYLTTQAIAIQQTTPPYSTTITDETNKNSITVEGGVFILKRELFSELSPSQEEVYFLFEGATIGKGKLQIIILDKNNAEIARGRGVWLDIDYIDTFFERAKATTNYSISDNGVDYTMPLPHDTSSSQPPQPVMSWEADVRSRPFVPDPSEDTVNKDYIIFVHGWRQAPGIGIPLVSSSLTYARTMYKRLWHSGYKGRFAAFRWPTFYGGSSTDDDIIAGFSTYNDSEYRAWKSGESLKQYVNQLPHGYRRTVAAHSMGNVVAGAAFLAGMDSDNYFMLNAAVPAIAYEAQAPRNPPVLKGVFGAATGHPNYADPITAPTPNDDPDATIRAKAYVNQFAPINSRVVNFYLAADSATLSSWNANNVALRPHRLVVNTQGYEYQPANSQQTKLLLFAGSPLNARAVLDAHEVMAYDCKSPTQTVNAEGAGTNGRIVGKVDMSTFNFAEEHSAQWKWSLYQTHMFYTEFINQLRTTP